MNNQIGQVGVITTIDDMTLWTVTRVHQWGLIVCSELHEFRNIDPKDFWVLVDSL